MQNPNPQVAAMAVLLLKKKYVDIAKNFTQMNPEQIYSIVNGVKGNMQL